MEIKSTHAIGDLVYLATAREVDREVIKAIKVVGLKQEVQYGFERKSDVYCLMFTSSDAHYWLKPSEIFVEREDAVAHHDRLRAKKEAEEAKDKARRKAERRAELEQELRDLDTEDGDD